MVKLLETLLEWLISLPLDKIPYEAILDLANNKMRVRLSMAILLPHPKELGFKNMKQNGTEYNFSFSSEFSLCQTPIAIYLLAYQTYY